MIIKIVTRDYEITPDKFISEFKSSKMSLKDYFSRFYATEMILLVGAPGSGKSTFASRNFPTYTRINKDTLGTDKKCLKACKTALDNYECVIIDNTNRENKNRVDYLNLAAERNITVKCFWLTAKKEIAVAQNRLREKKVPAIAINYYYAHFQEPMLSEGFLSITKIF